MFYHDKDKSKPLLIYQFLIEEMYIFLFNNHFPGEKIFV